MRRIRTATLLLTIVSLTASGCRQTTGPTNAGAMSPTLSPSTALSPVGTGQTPVLGPFGGPTRVTPPATGSYAAPNNYIGGAAPIGQPAAVNGLGAGVNVASGVTVAPGGVAPGGVAPGNVVGSGVQAAGWTETNTFQGNALPTAPPTLGVNSSAASNPRSGGMQVIDLTGSPAPPGYRPTVAPNSIPTAAPPTTAPPQTGWQSGVSQPSPTQAFPSQAPVNPGVQSQGFQSRTQTPAVQTLNVPTRGDIASLPPQAPIQDIPSTTVSPVQGPSTEPIVSGTAQQDLPWRRPGTQF